MTTRMRTRDGYGTGIYLLVLAFLLGGILASCGSLQYVGNPAPNMKTIHMATTHDGYTQQDVKAHPDYDCNGTYELIK